MHEHVKPKLPEARRVITLPLHLQIRRTKNWPDKGLRFIVAGREVYEDDVVAAAQTPVLHCMVTDTPVQSREHRPLANTDGVDWVRVTHDWCTALSRPCTMPTHIGM